MSATHERIAELRKRNAMFLSGGTSDALPHRVAPVGPRTVAAPTVQYKQPTPEGGNGKDSAVTRPSSGSAHQVGDLLRYEGRNWRVGLINDSRMRLDPVTPKKVQILDTTINDYGASVNISPNSVLQPVSSMTDEERRREAALIGRGTRTPEHVIEGKQVMAPVAAPPAEPKKKSAAPAPSEVKPNAARQANKERIQRLQEKNATNQAGRGGPVNAPGAPRPTKTKSDKTLKECMCGQCGEVVSGYFVQGHDARFKGWLLKVERGTMPLDQLPKKVRDAYEWKKKGDGYIPTRNYKGEPHSGYEKA